MISLNILIYFMLVLVTCVITNLVACYYPMYLFSQWKQECIEYLTELANPEEEANAITKLKVIKIKAIKWSFRLCSKTCSVSYPLYLSLPIINIISLFNKKTKNNVRNKLQIPKFYCFSNIVFILASYIIYQHWHTNTMVLVLTFIFSWGLLINSLIDYQYQILSDQITFVILWLGLLANALIYPFAGSIESAILAVIISYTGLFLLSHIYRLISKKEGIGYGDFKLLAAIGAWTGLSSVPFVLFFAAFIASITIGLKVIVKQHNTKHTFAFGPYIALAGWIMLLWGSPLRHYYFQWFS